MGKGSKLIGLALATAAGAAFAGTYLPGEGNFDVSVWQTTGDKPFREILTSPFTVHAYTNRAPIDVDAAVAEAARKSGVARL